MITTYVSVYTGSGLGTDALQRYNFPDATGRYVKLLITADSEGATASVYEFQVWGFDPISVVYPIDTLYSVPITGGDYIDLYSTPVSSSTDPIFGVTGTTSTDVQLRGDSGKTTVYNLSGAGSLGLVLRGATGSVLVFSATGNANGALTKVWNSYPYAGEYAAAGSVLIGKTVTKIVCRFKRVGNPAGSIYGFIDHGGFYTFDAGSGFTCSSISTSYTDYTFNFAGVTLAQGDVVGIGMPNGDASNYIDFWTTNPSTGGSNDGANTYGVYQPNGGGWTANPTTSDFYMSIYSGGGVPYHIAAEYVNSTSSVFYNKPITQVTIKMKKTGTVSSGSIYCRIRKSGGTTIAADAVIAASTLTTSFVAYTFNFTGNAYLMLTQDQVEVQFDGGDASNNISVQYDNTSAYDGTNSALKYQDTNSVWYSDTASDICGTMLQNNASPIVSAGEYIDDNTSVLFGQTIVKITVKLAKVGAPTGNIAAYILLSGGTFVTSTTTISAATLPVSTGSNYVATDFLFTTNAHVGAVGDTIYVAFLGGDPSNYVVVQREVGSSSGDGVHTTMRTQQASTAWTNVTTDDIACTFYVTNIIPASTQNRVVMNCAGDFGTFVNHVLNDFTFYLKKLGSPTGTIYFRIRDINDAIVQELGTFNAATLTTSNTTINFVNIATFVHRMVKGDKICVEYTSITGISADRVKVQQNDRTWFGDPDTNEQSYNNISYATVSNRVFSGIYKEGGQTVIFQEIDLQSEDITVQPGYSHDLFLFACLEFEQLTQTWTLRQGFWKGIFSQFRIYYDLLTLTQIQNLYANKISISTINYGEVLTGGDIMNLQP